MNAGDLLGHAIAVLVAAVFLYAASFKPLSTDGLQRTIAAIGVPPGSAPTLARAVPAFEFVLALAIVGFAPVAGVLLLLVAAIGIGGAGAIAVRNGLSVPCSCFSARSTARLGSRQLVFAGMMAVAAVVLLVSGPPSGIPQSLARLAAANLVGLLAHLLQFSRDLSALVGYRRSALSVYPS
jgi:Methylamine utilisation protein MauE